MPVAITVHRRIYGQAHIIVNYMFWGSLVVQVTLLDPI